MAEIVALDGIELVPVLELEPVRFSRRDRPSPPGNPRDFPEEWHLYWSDSLADSGIRGLRPIVRGAWHVPTTEFAGPEALRIILRESGGVGSPAEPDDVMALNGGLALRCRSGGVLIEPTCCADLGDASHWREAAASRQPEWQMLWIGHPWLSYRYRAPSLILSAPHESDPPAERWALDPDPLERAVAAAYAELERFAGQVAPALVSLGYAGDARWMGRILAGLEP